MASPDDLAIRSATDTDAGRVAEIWHQGWIDGHLGHVPDELVAARSAESFQARAAARVDGTTIVEVGGVVAGFVMVVGDEVEQVYLDRSFRGTGLAGVLLDQSEREVAAGGHEMAWLAVVAGNARARSFYAKRGWSDAGLFSYGAAGAEPGSKDTASIAVPCHRYEKRVG